MRIWMRLDDDLFTDEEPDGYGPEREREILKDVEDWRAGRLETVSLDELEEELGLDD